MPVKVIKEGTVLRKQIECPECHSVLEYSNINLNEDYNYEYANINVVSISYLSSESKKTEYYVKCPVCGFKVKASWIKNEPIKITQEQFDKLPDDVKKMFT